MPLTKEQKQKIIEKIKENLDKQKILVFVGIAGLKAGDMLNLGGELKNSNCLISVVKKTLLKIASKDKNLPIDTKSLEAELALVYGFGDELSAARIVNQFSRRNEKLNILGGIFENEFIDKEKVVALASIPCREELLAKLLGSINSPVANFVNVLQGNIKGLIYTLSNVNK